MSSEKVLTYTPDQVAQIAQAYQASPTQETVAALALQLNKTTRSVIAKLAQMKLYQAKTKAKSDRMTKEDLVAKVATLLGTAPMTSLEKASKEDLERLVAAVMVMADADPNE